MLEEKPTENQNSPTEDRTPRITLRISASTMIKVACQPPNSVWHLMDIPRKQTQQNLHRMWGRIGAPCFSRLWKSFGFPKTPYLTPDYLVEIRLQSPVTLFVVLFAFPPPAHPGAALMPFPHLLPPPPPTTTQGCLCGQWRQGGSGVP